MTHSSSPLEFNTETELNNGVLGAIVTVGYFSSEYSGPPAPRTREKPHSTSVLNYVQYAECNRHSDAVLRGRFHRHPSSGNKRLLRYRLFLHLHPFESLR